MDHPRRVDSRCLCLGSAHWAVSDDNWPQFRGSEALGVADNAGLPDTWSASENVLWKQDVPGRGWSSPIVWGRRVFLTTVTSDGDAEEQKRGLYLGGDRKKAPTAVHHWHVLAIDLATGAILWKRTAHEGQPPESLHLKNTYASETPVTDGQRVYAYFGNLGVFCYDFGGNLLWTRKFAPHKTANGWGTGASPALHAGRLFVLDDNLEDSYLTALDAATGEEIWRTKRPEKSGWATPFVWKNAVRTEIVTVGGDMARSYDLDGNELWRLGGMSGNSIPTPFAAGDVVYLSSGNLMARRKPLLAVRAGATGDITLTGDEASGPYVVWWQKLASGYNPTPLLYKDRLYVLRDLGVMACYDAKTGKELYERRRIPEGRAFTASPWAYHDQVFCLNEYGATTVLEAGPEFKVLRTNKLPEDEIYLATPAIAGDVLLIRGDRRLYAIGGSRASRREGDDDPLRHQPAAALGSASF